MTTTAVHNEQCAEYIGEDFEEGVERVEDGHEEAVDRKDNSGDEHDEVEHCEEAFLAAAHSLFAFKSIKINK